MSYEDSNERIRSKRGFRTTLDLGMGIFYAVIGGMILIFKSFADVKIPPVIAYILGPIMLIGGCARFYSGLKSVLQKKR